MAPPDAKAQRLLRDMVSGHQLYKAAAHDGQGDRRRICRIEIRFAVQWELTPSAELRGGGG